MALEDLVTFEITCDLLEVVYEASDFADVSNFADFSDFADASDLVDFESLAVFFFSLTT